MNKNLLQVFLIFFLLSSALFSQILNSGFENWTDGEPDNWSTNNIPMFAVGVTQSNESHSGSSAAKMEIKDFIGFPAYPFLLSGTEYAGFAVNQRYASLRGYYKFAPATIGHTFSVSAFMVYQGNYIGGGFFVTYDAANSYTEFDCQIDYYDPNIPDTILVEILVYDTTEGSITSGAVAFVDDLSLTGTVDVKEVASGQTPTSYNLLQNYPNPFNPSTKIEYTIPEESFIQLKVYNLIGQEVATLVNQHQKAGTYRADFDAEGMQSGIYIARLTSNSFTRSVKMTLLK